MKIHNICITHGYMYTQSTGMCIYVCSMCTRAEKYVYIYTCMYHHVATYFNLSLCCRDPAVKLCQRLGFVHNPAPINYKFGRKVHQMKNHQTHTHQAHQAQQ